MSSLSPKKQRTWVLVASLTLVVWYMGLKWQTSEYQPIGQSSSAKGNSTQGFPTESTTTETVSRIAFLTAVFKNSKPPASIARYILQKPEEAGIDSLKLALKWAQETQNGPLVSLLNSELFEFFNVGNLTDIARESVFLAASQVEDETQRIFLFQQGKRWIDIGLKKEPKNMPLRNALLVFQSEYLNRPMAFLETLKGSQNIDSNDLELNFIHLNLLKKSNQMEKALNKCEKLVSLQPQNPYWLFELSDLYGQKGDSVNAKLYLELAVKLQRKTQETNK
jgi:tetratricopeptide (TPR) repeat protein